MNRAATLLVLAHFAALMVDASAGTPFQDGDTAFFEARIRPILVDRCYGCHGPDEAAAKLAWSRTLAFFRKNLTS